MKDTELTMSHEEMVSMLDEAAGRLLVISMGGRYPEAYEAMKMITRVSLALGEVEEMTFIDYREE